MTRSVDHPPLRRLLMAAIFCGLVLGAAHSAVADDGGGYNGGGYYQGTDHRPDSSYRQGYRLGYRQGFDDGQRACDSDARHRDNRRRSSQSQYDRGYADGYNAGHRAACE